MLKKCLATSAEAPLGVAGTPHCRTKNDHFEKKLEFEVKLRLLLQWGTDRRLHFACTPANSSSVSGSKRCMHYD
jgi:hypothetical protein